MRLIRSIVFMASLAVAVPLPKAIAEPAFNEYVSLGDSVPSAPLVGGADLTDLTCWRGTNSLGAIVARDVGVGKFTEAACSGATIASMFEPQNTIPFNTRYPPQLNELRPSTDLVTIQLGNNDVLNFRDLMPCVALLPDPNWAPCAPRIAPTIDTRMRAFPQNFDRLLNEIGNRSPHAQVYVAGYANLVGDHACWPVVTLTEQDIKEVAARIATLNDLISTAAASHDMTYVDVAAAAVGHDMCRAPDVRWFQPVQPALDAFPLHPNMLGITSMANIVSDAIRR